VEGLEDRTVLSASLALSGPQTLMVNANVAVTTSPTTTESEMQVAINPTNPLNLVGFTHDVYSHPHYDMSLFFSMDGGLTWTRRALTYTSGGGNINDGQGQQIRFDPNVAFDANGNLFVAYLAAPPDTSGDVNDNASHTLVVGRSGDGGNSFTIFYTVDQWLGADMPHLATGLAGPGTTTQAVYVTYARDWGDDSIISVSGLRYGVDSKFTSPVNVGFVSGVWESSPAVGTNGELYVAWTNYEHTNNAHSTIHVDRKLNGLWGSGNFLGNVLVRVTNMPNNANRNYPTLQPPAADRRGFGPFPSLVVDRSNGPFRGRVYLAFTDLVSGNNSDIFLTYSTNQGATWAPLGSTGNVENAASTDLFATATVDPDTGELGVAYYSSLVSPQDNSQINLWVASSTDGGATFAKTQVTTARSREASAAFASEFLEWIGLDARDGTLQAFWADNRNTIPGCPPNTFDSNIHAYTASISTHNAGNQLKVTGDGIFTLRTDPANSAFADVLHNGVLEWAGLWASLGSVSITTGSGSDTVNIENSVFGVPVSVHLGQGGGTINLCPSSQRLDNIQSNLTLENDGGQAATLNVYDNNETKNDTYTLASGLVWASVTRTNAAIITYGLGPFTAVNINGGSGDSTYLVNGTAPNCSTTLNTGTGKEMVNVSATGSGSTLAIQPNTKPFGGAKSQVTIGDIRTGLAYIKGQVSVFNGPNGDQLTIDDSADGGNHPNVSIGAGRITGLAAALNFTASSISTLTVKGGSGTSTYTISGTPTHDGMTLDTGAGAATVNVQAASVPLTVDATAVPGGNGQDVVTIGNAGSLAGITAAVTIHNGPARDQLTIDDSADGTKHANVAISATGITGLAPQPLNFTAFSISTLTVKGGSNSNTYTISGTPAATSVSLNTGTGFDTVNIQAVSASLTVTTASRIPPLGKLVGTNVISLGNASGLAGIQAPVTLGTATRLETITPTIALTVDDRGNKTTPMRYTLSNTSLSWQAQGSQPPPPLRSISYHGLKSLVLNSGQGKNTFTVTSPAPTFPVTYHGGQGSNTLIGPNSANTWTITGSNAGTLGHLTFTAVQNLTGGSDTDTFQFQPGGGLTGSIDGGPGHGSNTLDFSALPNFSVWVSLQTLTGNINYQWSFGFAHIQSLVGSPNSTKNYDQLHGPDGTTTWTINGPNAGQVGGVSFSGFGTVVGGNGLNVYKFLAGGAVLSLVGSTGPVNYANWLDYSALSTTPVTVNLTPRADGTATAMNVVNGISGIINVRGGNAGNTLTGNTLFNNWGNILIGGSGADVLTGGKGVSLLIGSKGADKIQGASGGDLLIGGSTDFDSNNAALMAILAEWQSNAPYVVRMSHLTMGGGLNGMNKLVADVTVHDDGTADSLTGGAALTPGALDWFFKGPQDTLSNYEAGELITPVGGIAPTRSPALLSFLEPTNATQCRPVLAPLWDASIGVLTLLGLARSGAPAEGSQS
jgi:hypothetical protein